MAIGIGHRDAELPPQTPYRIVVKGGLLLFCGVRQRARHHQYRQRVGCDDLICDLAVRFCKSGEVHDYVKRAKDTGVLAGVSAHNPDCIKQVADEGWETDFFMNCFYNIPRKPEEEAQMPPVVTVQTGKPFFASDPATMTEVMRQVDKPCLGFKILGGGRKCANQDMVRGAFRFAFENIKPTDGVIVGMFPKYFDEVGANAGYTRTLGGGKSTA